MNLVSLIFKYVFSIHSITEYPFPFIPKNMPENDEGRFSSVDDEPIKFDRYRFAGNSNSSSMDETRKNRVIVTTGTLHAPPSFSLDNRTRPRTRWGGRRKYSKNHYRRNFHTFRNSLGKAFNPREEKMRRSEGERGRRRLKRQKEQGHERAAFRFPHHFAPFTEGRAPRKGWLTALIVPVVTVYSDFHPVFFTRFLPLFFQLNPPTLQFK